MTVTAFTVAMFVLGVVLGMIAGSMGCLLVSRIRGRYREEGWE
mgnify:CR=1 FL=1